MKTTTNLKLVDVRAKISMIKSNFGVVRKMFSSIQDAVISEKDEQKVGELRKQVHEKYENE